MLRIINPATEELVSEVETDTPETVATKYREARLAQPAWAARPFEEKVGIIERFGELLAERRSELAAILTSEMGKPLDQASGEVRGVQGRIDFFIKEIEETIGRKEMHRAADESMIEAVSYEPLGVIGNISAWNYPYFVGSNVFIPALLVGNTMLYKPSEFATLTGLEMARALHEAGVPKDVFVPVVGDGAIGKALLDQPLDGMFFTGSHATGVKIAEAASRKMMRVQLELGGKDPSYVAEDVVDVAGAADAVAGGVFYNAGQSCCSIERVYVHEAVYEQFVESFLKVVGDYGVGSPVEEGIFVGPLTREPQRAILAEQVRDAVSKGATLRMGGKSIDGPGYFFEPTVLTEVSHEMLVMQEESFGPVIGIQRVTGDDEALQLMNDTRYGLTASVYTADGERARTIMGQLNAGSVYWNCCDRVSPRLPWTGWGDSGVGSTLGYDGIRAFVQPKAWHLRQG